MKKKAKGSKTPKIAAVKTAIKKVVKRTKKRKAITMEDAARKCDRMAKEADEAAKAQAATGVPHDPAVAYWAGAAASYRRAAKLLREG